MAQSDMDIALEQVRRAAMREANQAMPPMITMFMGMTPKQIHYLKCDWEARHPLRAIPE